MMVVCGGMGRGRRNDTCSSLESMEGGRSTNGICKTVLRLLSGFGGKGSEMDFERKPTR